jgi:uncharacterized phage protein gp47/JayE
MARVTARVLAGAVHMLHGHLEYVSRQVFPDTADGDNLLRWADLFGVPLRPATYASGPVVFTGTNDVVVGAGTMLQDANGVEFSTDVEGTIAAGEATIAVTAILAGSDGNRGAGIVLSLQSPIAGVDSVATVDTGGIVNGTDENDSTDLRARVLARLKDPPHGGSAADYVAWTLEVPGATRAWCYPLEDGDGTVVVRFVRDDDASIIPDAGEVAVVQAYLDERAPATAEVTVEAPTAVELDYTISITPDNSTTRAAVAAELVDLLRRIATPGGTIPLSQIEVAVGTAAGVTDFAVTVPAADVTHATGQIAVPGDITWA